MSLLAQALGGALNAGATTASNMIQENEKAKAQALRDENLAKLNTQRDEQKARLDASLKSQQADVEYNRGPSGMVSTETGAALTRDELKNNPDLAITPEQYKKDQEGYRAQEIGTAVAPVADSFKWDAKDPQGSAVKYMQALRATGELSEAEVATEANRMMQAKMPKEKKLQVATIPMGGATEQSVIINLEDGTYTPIGKPGQKFKDSGDGTGTAGKGRLTENQASAIVAKMTKIMREGETLTDAEQELFDFARARLGKPVKPKLDEVFRGSGETMPIPPRGQQPKGMIATEGKQPAAAKRPPLDQFWK